MLPIFLFNRAGWAGVMRLVFPFTCQVGLFGSGEMSEHTGMDLFGVIKGIHVSYYYHGKLNEGPPYCFNLKQQSSVGEKATGFRIRRWVRGRERRCTCWGKVTSNWLT
jgi:hypothetical protein